MIKLPRLALAVFVSPLAIGPAIFIWLPILYLVSAVHGSDLHPPGWLLTSWVEATLFIGFFGGIAALVANFIIGLPLYLGLRYFDLAEPLPGALLAGAVALALADGIAAEGEFVSIFAVSAAAVGAAFCRLANGPRN